jgi:hypothetical protein
VRWGVAAWAQQPAMPVIGFVQCGSADAAGGYVAAFRKGLAETGYVEGQNVTHCQRGWHVRKECAAKARNHSRVA